jgi:Predicted transcriptional regulator
MDQPKIERLLRLMKMLTANDSYSVNDIAERLNISVRSVYRYIDTFREAGFVVKKKGDFVRLDKSSPYFKDISELIHFTEEEAYILKSAIESIDENNLLKQNLKRKLYTVYDYKILAETIVSGKNARNVQQLVTAIEEKRKVILHNYSSAHGGTVRDRIVEPFAFTTNYVQVWCYDLEEQSNKLFKISRIDSVNILPHTWTAELAHHSGFIDVFRISSDQSFPVQLKLGLRATNLLTEEYPLATKYLKRISEKEWLLQTEVCSFDGIGRFIIRLAEDIEIINPPELENYIFQRIKNIEEKFQLS